MSLHAEDPRSRLVMSLLEERYYRVTPQCPVVCRLWAMRPSEEGDRPLPSPIPTYAIGMESPTERYLYCVGIHEEDARALFSRVTEGELSPVHLGDVVADLLWEQGQRAKEAGEISQKTLQTDQSMI